MVLWLVSTSNSSADKGTEKTCVSTIHLHPISLNKHCLGKKKKKKKRNIQLTTHQRLCMCVAFFKKFFYRCAYRLISFYLSKGASLNLWLDGQLTCGSALIKICFSLTAILLRVVLAEWPPWNLSGDNLALSRSNNYCLVFSQIYWSLS